MTVAVLSLVLPHVLPWAMFRARATAVVLLAWLAVPLGWVTCDLLLTDVVVHVEGTSDWWMLLMMWALWMSVWAAWRHTRAIFRGGNRDAV